MSLFKKISEWNWGALEVVLLLAIAVVGWAVSMEVRLSAASDVNARIKNIEELMYPMLVEWEVEQRMKILKLRPDGGLGTRGHWQPDTTFADDPPPVHIHEDCTVHEPPRLAAPKIIPKQAAAEYPILEEIEKEARHSAARAIMQAN